MTTKLEVRHFIVREASWEKEGYQLSNIRKLVFIVEQKVPAEEEWDGRDESSWHWIATDEDDVPIGTARLLPDGQIGRMAVLPHFRGCGVGRALLEKAVDKARHLGFREVFLNAQSHALAFYERAGFSKEGEEFEEAGIPHFRMTQSLRPLDDKVQRRAASGSGSVISIRDFDTREVAFHAMGTVIRKVRELVLVRETGLPAALIGDDADPEAIHWIAEATDGMVTGVLRMSRDGEISRLAVLPEYRGHGVAHSLLELAEARALRLGLAEVRLDALARLDGFYQRAGYTASGEPREIEGFMHQTYRKPLRVTKSGIRKDAVASTDPGPVSTDHALGGDGRLILLRKEEDFRNIIQAMAAQANHILRIYSPVLEHKLFNVPDLREIISALARKNRHTRIEILMFDSHRVVKNGHVLLEIARKLSSSIRMKIVHPDYRQQNHEYVLADHCGVIYRLDHEVYEGYANFNDVTDCSRLGRQFSRAWESGLEDPNLRQLRI